jgi:hypothetical protein
MPTFCIAFYESELSTVLTIPSPFSPSSPSNFKTVRFQCRACTPATPPVLLRSVHSGAKFRKVRSTQTRECIDWRWSLSCVTSVMMVFSVQLAEDEGPYLPSFTLSTPHLQWRRPHHHRSPLFPSLWARSNPWYNIIYFISLLYMVFSTAFFSTHFFLIWYTAA